MEAVCLECSTTGTAIKNNISIDCGIHAQAHIPKHCSDKHFFSSISQNQQPTGMASQWFIIDKTFSYSRHFLFAFSIDRHIICNRSLFTFLLVLRSPLVNNLLFKKKSELCEIYKDSFQCFTSEGKIELLFAYVS